MLAVQREMTVVSEDDGTLRPFRQILVQARLRQKRNIRARQYSRAIDIDVARYSDAHAGDLQPLLARIGTQRSDRRLQFRQERLRAVCRLGLELQLVAQVEPLVKDAEQRLGRADIDSQCAFFSHDRSLRYGLHDSRTRHDRCPMLV